MRRQEILRKARLAGQVRRYHTWPMHQTQTIGEHSWQVMRIWWALWGPMSPEVSTYLLWHDAGELKTGDLPFPLKSENPDIKQAFDRLEDDALEDMGGFKPALGHLAALRVKVCDLIEMSEHGLIELAMGNTFALPIWEDTKRQALELAKQLPPIDHAVVVEYYASLTKEYVPPKVRLADVRLD